MGIVNKEQRMATLRRQEMLYQIHCKSCVNRNEKSSVKWCDGCAIYEEFKKIGRILDDTVRERKDVS